LSDPRIPLRRECDDELGTEANAPLADLGMCGTAVDVAFTAEAEESAFGAPGKAGDPSEIAALASDLSRMYEGLLREGEGPRGDRA
jgi:hypothetical protein